MNETASLPIPFVDLKTQYFSIRDEMDAAIARIIEDSAFIGGAELEGFEADFAKFCGSQFCIGVANGTDALFLALWAAGVGEGDEVVMPANSFIATSEAVSLARGTVRFLDINSESYNLDFSALETTVTRKTKAIISVHLYGRPVDMDKVLEFAQKNDLIVIEDAAQAHGALYKDRKIGSLGALGCFSFYPSKNLGAYGDAGAIVTDDEELATRIRMKANHGRKSKYDHQFEGVNSRLDGFQAAVLRVKLRYIEEWNESRRRAAARYTKLLAEVDEVTTPLESPDSQHVFHLYVIRVKDRDALQNYLHQKGVSTGIHYPIPLHELEAYQYLGYRPEDFPVTSQFAREILSLPMFPELREGQIHYIVQKIKEFYSK